MDIQIKYLPYNLSSLSFNLNSTLLSKQDSSKSLYIEHIFLTCPPWNPKDPLITFPTYFLVSKSSAHFSDTQNTPGLQKKEKTTTATTTKKKFKKKLQKRTPKNPIQSNENNPARFFSLQPSALLTTRPQAEIASGMARRQRPGGLAGDPVSSEATGVWSPASTGLPKNGIFVQRDFYGLDYCKVNRDRSNSEGFHSQCQSLFHYLKL